ncbi:MAG TPA: multidrug effflux MFS transporter [Bauldia sp.]|nr:multidrug effflux MFS transporter [Bauldia sp.]
MRSTFARNAIVLGLLSAVGPFAIDMYLPALPTIAEDFHASAAAAQGSLMAFFLAVALCQIIYGPVSDSFGRKAPLYVGSLLYVVGAVGCSFAPSIEWLIFARFVQGVGACAGMTIPRAVVRDLHTGHEAARLMSLLMLVFSVSPILAPLFGSAVIAFGTWREIFLAMGVAAILALFLVIFALKETRPAEQRIPFDLGTIAASYGELFRDRHYLGLVLIGGFGMASFFAFLSGSSFVYIQHFGLLPWQYSIAFSVNAVAFIGMAQATGYFGKRFGLPRVVRSALTFYVVSTGTLFLLTIAGVDNMYVMAALLWVGFAAMGLVIPSTAALSLENYGRTAGTAAALMGTLQLVVGAVVVGLVGTFSNGGVLPMAMAILACALVAFFLGLATLRGAAPRPVELETEAEGHPQPAE